MLLDPFGVRPAVELSPVEHELYLAIAARQAPAALARIARRHGLALDDGELDRFTADLSSAGLFEDAAAAAARRDAFRRALAADTFVIPGTADDAQLCERLLAEARAANERELGPTSSVVVEGCLSPHGALSATGDIAARNYALLDAASWPDVFVILGTSHYGGRASILIRDVHTPLGLARCHRTLATRLADRFGLERDAPELAADHSWRQDVPLLQAAARHAGRDVRIVPILLGGLDFDTARELGRAIRELAFDGLEHACVIASGDLTHYGGSYAWRPRWLAKPRSVDAVVDAIRRRELPVLEAVRRRDQARFARLVEPTSFCARAQVAAVMERATVDGTLLAHRAVVNWRAYARPSRRRWGPQDAVFDGAALVFARGLPAARERRAPRLCANVLVRRDGDELFLVHRCDLATIAVPEAASPVLAAMWQGAWQDAWAPFAAELASAGFVHEPEAPSTRAPRLVEHRAPRDLARRPFVLPDDLRGAPAAIPAGDYDVRRSSASSGKAPVVTIVEKPVRGERQVAEVLVQPLVTRRRSAHVNRPANLSLSPGAEGWPAIAEIEGALAIAPGPNPSAIPADVWRRVVARLVEYAPEQLEGDPAYVAGLARACAAMAVRLPSVTSVFTGHGYCWQVYRDAIVAAFGVAPIVRYHASELGEIAIGCRLGRLHLLDVRTYYELVTEGRHAEVGELAMLVATTLDTRVRPLVRYAPGDVVRLVATACPCGKPFRVIEVAGRVSHLIARDDGRPITYAELDAAIGAPAGVAHVRLDTRAPDARLTLVPVVARELCDAAAACARLSELLQRRVTAEFADALDVPAHGKLDVLRAEDRSAAWRARFLGSTERGT